MNKKLLVAQILFSSSVFAADINTYQYWDGATYGHPWGWNDVYNLNRTRTYGQVIIPDSSQTNLNDFTFYLRNSVSVTDGTALPQYKAYVYEFDSSSSKIIGSPLYSSDTLIAPNSPSSFSAIKISTGGISLTSGNKYMLFFSTSGITQLAAKTYAYDFASNTTIHNSSGSKFFYNNNDVLSDLLSVGWTDYNIEMAFLATFGPSAADTQSSMRYQVSQLRSAFNTQTVAANFALNYDCNVFDAKGMCISAGGRYTTIDNPNINNSAATVTLGYKVNSNIRVGAYLDQNIHISNPASIDISNNTPLMGLYAVLNKEPNDLGYQVRVANTYQDKDVTQTRTVFDTSEAGTGRSSLKSQSYLAELSYAFQYEDKTLVRPYAGLRYTHLKQNGYTEETTNTVTDPLTVAALRDKGTTALLGVKINRSLTDKATLTAQLGLEQDFHHKVDQYSATDLNGSDLTAIAFNGNIKRTRPVASMGAFYNVTRTQRASATINYQQTPFHSTGSATAYFNYMIGF